MKTEEELNSLKEEIKSLNQKLSALTEDELAQVTGGVLLRPRPMIWDISVKKKENALSDDDLNSVD